MPFAAHTDNALLGKVAKGWQLNGIVTFQAGQPVNLYANTNASQQDNYLDRPNIEGPVPLTHHAQKLVSSDGYTSDCIGTSDRTATGNFWFDPYQPRLHCLSRPESVLQWLCTQPGIPLLTYGDLPRNYIRGPGINNSVSFCHEADRLQGKHLARISRGVFNAFNHVQFLRVDNGG